MDEAELCDRVALVQDGNLLSVDTPARIRENYRHKLWALRAENMYSLKNDLAGYEDIRSVFLFGRDLHITLIEEERLNQMKVWLAERGHKQIHVEAIQPGVEDCFMELMSKDEISRLNEPGK
jgi:ABC-type multidrug transport system ATPase subunit